MTTRKCQDCDTDFVVTDASARWPQGTWASCPTCRGNRESKMLAKNAANLRQLNSKALYRVVDAPVNGSAGQDCGVLSFADLPSRIQAAIQASPDASEWRLPALSDGDTGDELADLTTVVTRELGDD